MNNSKTLAGLIVAGLLIVAIIGWFTPVLPKANGVEGVNTGSMAAEDYNPYIMYNGGYYSAKPIETTSTLTVGGASSFTGLITVGSGGIKIGSTNGSTLTQVISTTCNPIANVSVAATSTAHIYCTGVTGVTSSSQVFAEFATSTNAIGTQWVMLGSKASTTAGAIDFKIMNLTGTAAVPSAAAGASFASSTKLLIVN